MAKVFLRAAAVGVGLGFLDVASAECANACSGHGTCGAKDACSCYANYQGNDCSERTCYFGLAHVDTPKGDLNGDGIVSGPLTTVITGSEVYPWGTTEQFPNANAEEGHFYMECSNKGMCNRQTGACECFDGYDGTACMRASCPNDCSGHGTCESIKELAEMQHFDTQSQHVATTNVAGSTAHHEYDGRVRESYSYDLWDMDKSMGCKCDPGYFAADCSQKKCRYGVDPLYFDNQADGVIYQTAVVHLGSKSTDVFRKEPTSGTFRLVFYDTFGERYVTKNIDASYATGTAEKVQRALEALPNRVITAKVNRDVTQAPPAGVLVTKQNNAGTHATTGGIGQGAEGSSGTGLGARGEKGVPHGVEYTITFNNNAGMLRALEVDTELVTAFPTSEHWVANQRQGTFASRYSVAAGRVNTMMHGSTRLYTNADMTQTAPANKMIKIGGQEMRVISASSTSYQLLMSEPFLGASILPILTETGISVNALAETTPCATCATGLATNALTVDVDVTAAVKVGDTISVGEVCASGTKKMVVAAITATTITVVAGHTCVIAGAVTLPIILDFDELTPTAALPNWKIARSLMVGAKLYAGDCAYTSADADLLLNINPIRVDGSHDCFTDQLAGGKILYRRSDDVSNLNIYMTPGDTAIATQKLLAKRGTNEVYIVAPLTDSATPAVQLFAKSYASTGTKFTLDVAAGAAGVVGINEPIFVNGHGPIIATTAVSAADTEIVTATANEVLNLFGDDFAGSKYPVVKGVSDSNSIAAGNVLVLNGRRYRVKAAPAATGALASNKILLSENYAGGSLAQVCASCVTDVPADGLHITTNLRVATELGDKLLVGGYVHDDLAVTVAYVGNKHGDATPLWQQTSQKTSAGTHYGDVLSVHSVDTTVCASCATSISATEVATGTDLTGTSPPIAVGDKVAVGTCTTGSQVMTVTAVVAAKLTVAAHTCPHVAAGTLAVVKVGHPTAVTSATAALYKLVNGNALGFTGSLVTEVANEATFQYVAQCSNRGMCNTETGLCECFSGYTNDNCDTQNALAM